jgi:putative Mg2+ transporter-C (MgtC) family protein
MDWEHSIIRLGLALALTFPIGWNRESAHKTAGLRTHLLVSLGSCLFTLISIGLSRTYGGDAGRVAAQIVTGIGFLGGGAILREGFTVRGITTAASVWSTSAVGMACGAGLFPGAVAGAIATFGVLKIVEQWEASKKRGRRTVVLTIRVRAKEGLSRVRETLASFGVRTGQYGTESDPEQGECWRIRVEAELAAHVVSRLVEHFLHDPDVIGVESEVR